jgi:hypothetical protein
MTKSPNTTNSYQKHEITASIEQLEVVDERLDDDANTARLARRILPSSVLLMTCLIVAGVCLLSRNASSYMHIRSNKSNLLTSLTTTSSLPLEGASHTSSSKTRACTFDECLASKCDHTLASFTCLTHNGGPHGGCADSEWTADSCTESCNLSGCDSLKIPDSVKGCNGVKCPKEWCQIGQLCGSDAPYQCTDGPGRYGCSAEAYHWVYNSCPCCDVTSCE